MAAAVQQVLAADVEAPPAISADIGADEIALYDRQIRLWGVKAQEKIRKAHILLVNVKALGNEIAKNLVLAGIGSLTLVDNGVVTEDDLGAQFFLTEADIGSPRAVAAAANIRKINPRVNVRVETRDLSELLTLPSYFSTFAVTIATDLAVMHFNTLNAAARISNCPFYAAGSHGMYGFIFADLITHTFAVTRGRSNILPKPGTAETATRTLVSAIPSRDDDGKPIELVTKTETYQPLILTNTSPLAPEILSSPRRLRRVTPLLPCLRALWEFETLNNRPPTHGADDLKAFTTLATEKSRELTLPMDTLKSEFLRSFMQNIYAELAPVTAFLGGQLAQDVINVLGQREQPIQNLLLFDGETSTAPVYALSPIVTTLDAAIPLV